VSAKGAAATKKSAAVSIVSTPKAKKATAKPTLAAVKSDVPAGEKYCKRHDTLHPFEAFAKDRSSKSGYYSICRAAEADDREAKKAATVRPVPAAAVPAPKKGKKK
jgi:hypothetical protein